MKSSKTFLIIDFLISNKRKYSQTIFIAIKNVNMKNTDEFFQIFTILCTKQKYFYTKL